MVFMFYFYLYIHIVHIYTFSGGKSWKNSVLQAESYFLKNEAGRYLVWRKTNMKKEDETEQYTQIHINLHLINRSKWEIFLQKKKKDRLL